MKIAIPVIGNSVNDQFGLCSSFDIYDLDEKNKSYIKAKELNSMGCGCSSLLINNLANENINVVLVGNIGKNSYEKLKAKGIEAIRGVNGNTDIVIKNYLSGAVKDSGLNMTRAHKCDLC